MQSGSTPPAGWFPDPAGSGGERWWSGEGWTEHLRQAAAVAVAEPPAPVAPAVPQVSVSAPAQSHPSFPPTHAEADSTAASGTGAPSGLLEAMARADAARAQATPPIPAAAPAVPVAPAVAPVPTAPASVVGFTSGADASVAARYRSAIPSAEPVQPSAPSLAHTTPPTGSIPHFDMSGYSASTGRQTGETNKVARSALIVGGAALVFAIACVFFDRVAIGVVVSGIAAIVQGIIGIVRARQSGNGLGAAVGGLVAGALALVVLVVSVSIAVVTALTPSFDVPALEDEIVYAGQEYGYDMVSANCPDDPPVAAGTEFTCIAYDTAEVPHAVKVVNDDDYYYTIYFDDTGF